VSIDVEALKAKADISAVIGHYVALKKRGAEFVGRCPFHSPDNNPSFYVVPAKGIYHCFACGASGDVIEFLMEQEGLDFKAAAERLNGGAIEWKPVTPIKQEASAKQPERITSKPPADAPTPNMAIRALGEPSRIWPYRDTDGGILGYVARYETPEGKQIRCWTWGARADNAPQWACGHWNSPRPLYRRDGIAQRDAAPVLVVEGEKTADAAQALLPAYAVMTWPGGAQAWHKADWTPLKGRKVLLWPDNDAPGLECMDKLAALLSDERGFACSVRIIDPNRMPEGFDAADWTGTTEELIAWAKPRAKDYAAPTTALQQNPAPPQEPESPPPSGLPTPGTAEGAGPPDEPIPLEAYRDDPGAQPKRRRRARLSVVDGGAVPAPDPEAEPLPVAMSEDALADTFAELNVQNWRYVSRWGQWFKWCGDVWQEDHTSEAFSIARQICRASIYWPEAASMSSAERRKISRKATAGSVRDMAGTDRRIAATTEQWDTDHWLLGVPGGVVDLRTGKLMDGEPEQYITKKCAVLPLPGPHPLFDNVLERACGGDASMRPYLLRFFGYILTGDVREECFLFLHGPGGSGKGTLVKCLGDILGDYAKTISMEALIESKAQRHPQELAKLDRARFVYASETEEGRRWNESLIKWLTGRDKVTAHFMRENDFEFYPHFKLLIYGNHIPHLKSVGEEMRRRVHMIEYAGSLADEDRDTTLKDKLVAEYPAILATMIRACLEWQDCGLGKPERVTDATANYLQSEDTLGIWIEDNVTRSQNARTLSGDVYRDFKHWADAAGEYAMSQKRFVGAMRQRGFDAVRAGGKRYLDGLMLKTPPTYVEQQRYPDD
jgi:P4 family phage/plasmid primase-like protien